MDHVEELKLPIGITDFVQIRTGGYYYVDKMKLIREIGFNIFDSTGDLEKVVNTCIQ